MIPIATNIKALCAQRQISVAEVEREVGLGNGVIRRWDEASPTVINLKAVADLLGVSIEELLRE